MSDTDQAEKPFCSACGGHHEPDSEDSWVEYEGYRFSPPFKCMCCGKEICARQFAYGRCCGPCDMGACQPGNTAYRPTATHADPAWRTGSQGVTPVTYPVTSRDEQIAKLAEAVGAIRLPASDEGE